MFIKNLIEPAEAGTYRAFELKVKREALMHTSQKRTKILRNNQSTSFRQICDNNNNL